MRFKQGRELKKTKIEIIPMIDTMFFLLVFFILSSVGIIKLQGISIDLPKPGPPHPEQINPEKEVQVTVTIGPQEQVWVDKLPIRAGADIGPVIQREILKQKGPAYDFSRATVVISADPAASHGAVVRAIDQAHFIGIGKFALANQPVTAAPAR
jgi:biopolymer transport protein ExbD